MQMLQVEDNNKDSLSKSKTSNFKQLDVSKVVTREMLMNLNRLAVADTHRVEP